MTPVLKIANYDYDLPDIRIAQKAAEPRDSSKLLYFNKGGIKDHVFKDILKLLPAKTTLFFNNARVIPARIMVKNTHGANIEIFLLQPYAADYFTAINAHNRVEWTCLIRNKKKWKNNEILHADAAGTHLEMEQLNEERVGFTWTGNKSFIELLDQLGMLPLPPYIRHKAGKEDEKRYQTVYSKIPGSVAAPTAGLHFTDKIMKDIDQNNIRLEYLTLHVSAGTFLPVKTDNAMDHIMHKEIFSIRLSALKALLETESILAVGTTSCRVLESLYWCSVNILNHHAEPFHISQFAAFEIQEQLPVNKKAIEILIKYCEDRQLDELHGQTSIMITPGYRFRFVTGLITNFHQPKSTLLLLISAFIGENWKNVYAHALKNDYRFLSYGDSSLLLP